MKKLLCLLFALVTLNAVAQRDSVITSPPLNATTVGLSQFTFEVSASQAINIIGFGTATNGVVNLDIWYRIGGVGTAPIVISTANGWVQAATGVTIPTSTAPTFVPVPSNFSINVPANTPVGIYFNGSLRYSSQTGPPEIFTDNVLTIDMTQGKGNGGGSFPNMGTTNRKVCGWVTYELAAPCSAPVLGGTAVSSNMTPCPARNFNLSLTGNSAGLGMQYQWQTSSDNINFFDITGQTNPGMTTWQLMTTHYRCRLICGSDTAFSTPVTVSTTSVTIPGGTYSINSMLPTAGTNYTNFTDFFNLANCGSISGAITLNVAPGTGPYNEQFIIENIGGLSAINSITINGNGEIVEFNTTNNNQPAVITLEKASHITIQNLIVRNLGTSLGYGIHMRDSAHHNTIKNCQIEIPQNTTSNNFAGVVLGSGNTAIIGAPNFPHNNTIEDNTITGGYYGVTIIGNGNGVANRAVGNKLINNTIHDFYFYGLYSRSQEDYEYSGNDFARPTRAQLSSFYGMYFINEHWGGDIFKNQIHDPFAQVSSTSVMYPFFTSGANGDASKPNNFYNNIFYNLTNNGTLYALYNSSSSFWNYYHNSFHVDDVNPTAGLTYLIYFLGTSNSVEFRNNVVSMRRSGTSVKELLRISGSGTRVFDNNAYWIDLNVGASSFGTSTGLSATFADWQTANPTWDANSVFIDPDFTFPQGGLLIPQVGAIYGLGANLLSIVPTDYLDSLRPNPPSSGAFEFAPPACSDPFSLDTVSLTTSSATITWGQVGNVTQWDIEWGPVGFVAGTAGVGSGTVTTNPHTISSLTPGNCYDVYIRANCTNFNQGVGSWVGPLQFCLPYDHDLALSALIAPAQPTGCGDSAMVVSAEIFNNGTLPATNFQVEAIVSGDFTATLNTTFTGTIAPGMVDTVVIGTLNTYLGGTISVDVNITYGVDQNTNNNDGVFNNIFLVPGTPQFTDPGTVCYLQDSVDLEAQVATGIVYNWWDASTAGNLLFTGNPFRVPTTNPGPYWLEYAVGGNRDSLETEFIGTTTTSLAGAMFDVNILKSIFIESFDVHPGGSGPTDVHVYYKTGSFLGSENDPSAWTLVEVVPVQFTGALTQVRVPLTNALQLNDGQVYGIYIQPISITLRYSGGAAAIPPGQVVVQNQDLQILGSVAKGGANPPFGTSTLNPRLWNGRINYRGPDGCESPRVPVQFAVHSDTALASFTSNQTAPGSFDFDASASTGHLFHWDFGDAGTSNVVSPSHTYATAGNFSVTLIVTDTICNSTDTMVMNVTSTISLEDFKIDQALNVYPNPSRDAFHISFELDGARDIHIRVVSPTGQLIHQDYMPDLRGAYKHTLDLNGQSRGIYILQIQTSKGVVSRRLILI
jgi:PKD repeat protein